MRLLFFSLSVCVGTRLITFFAIARNMLKSLNNETTILDNYAPIPLGPLFQLFGTRFWHWCDFPLACIKKNTVAITEYGVPCVVNVAPPSLARKGDILTLIDKVGAADGLCECASARFSEGGHVQIESTLA